MKNLNSLLLAILSATLIACSSYHKSKTTSVEDDVKPFSYRNYYSPSDRFR